MDIFVLGLNHKTAPLELRERLAIPRNKTPEFLKHMAERHISKERLMLSTCNRTEIYGAGPDPSSAIESAKSLLSEYAHVERGLFEKNLYVLQREAAVEHLFSVASGLDSLVVGETEIIGQVKDAYLEAQREGQTGKVLNRLFERSLKVAKDLRTQTEIGEGRVSIASVAADLAGKIFGELKGTRVMVLGTGEMATLLLRTMHARQAKLMVVSSHRFDRAEALGAELGAEPVHYDFYAERMKDVDILITSTLAPTVLIHEAQVRQWMKERQERPLFMIDLAVPRNIEGSAAKPDNAYLYNIDDLRTIADRNAERRRSQLEECSRLVTRQTGLFMDWLKKEFGGQA